MVKRQYHRSPYNASQTYDRENYTTITFKDSPLCGQKARILKEIQGRHPELQLELLNGDKIRIDALWTDYQRLQLPRGSSLDQDRIDLAQAEAIIRFIEYLVGKSTTDSQ
jgi:hypothetical protein